MLGYVYGKHIAGSDSNFSYRALQPSQDLAIKIASPAGSLLGQLLFGWLADLLGRKRMCKAIPLPAPLPISDETTPLSLPSFRWHRINYHDHWYLRSVTLGRGGCGQHHRCAIHMEIHRECGLDLLQLYAVESKCSIYSDGHRNRRGLSFKRSHCFGILSNKISGTPHEFCFCSSRLGKPE